MDGIVEEGKSLKDWLVEIREKYASAEFPQALLDRLAVLEIHYKL